MARRKKRPRDENDDEFKSAHAQFDNPFTKKIRYTMTSASAGSSIVKTVHQDRIVAYHPPSVPLIIVRKPPESITEEPTLKPGQKTQQIRHTMTSASAGSSIVKTVHQNRIVAYHPPSVPLIVGKPPELITEEPTPTSSEPGQKTQSSVILDQFGSRLDDRNTSQDIVKS